MIEHILIYHIEQRKAPRIDQLPIKERQLILLTGNGIYYLWEGQPTIMPPQKESKRTKETEYDQCGLNRIEVDRIGPIWTEWT